MNGILRAFVNARFTYLTLAIIFFIVALVKDEMFFWANYFTVAVFTFGFFLIGYLLKKFF